jgi:hypothetical protein
MNSMLEHDALKWARKLLNKCDLFFTEKNFVLPTIKNEVWGIALQTTIIKPSQCNAEQAFDLSGDALVDMREYSSRGA